MSLPILLALYAPKVGILILLAVGGMVAFVEIAVCLAAIERIRTLLSGKILILATEEEKRGLKVFLILGLYYTLVSLGFLLFVAFWARFGYILNFNLFQG